MRRFAGSLLILPVAAAAFVFGAGACVDLFHSTDFATLCDLDAAACATDGGGGEADGAEPAVDSGKPIDFCTNTSAEARELAKHACAQVGACLGGDSHQFGNCYVRALFAYDCQFNPTLRPRDAAAKRWDCLTRATTCSAVEQCVLGGPKPVCNAFDGGLFIQCAADGKTLVECRGASTPASVTPCAHYQQSCTNDGDSNARCTGARQDCTTATTGTAGCRGTSLYLCTTEGSAPYSLGVDCGEMGAGRCVDSAKKPPGCVPSDGAPLCTSDEANATGVVCEGDVAKACVDGSLVRIDCQAAGEHCHRSTSAPSLPLFALACYRDDDAGTCAHDDRCNGSVLESCSFGGELSVDCAKVPGMKTCGVSASGWATCKP